MTRADKEKAVALFLLWWFWPQLKASAEAAYVGWTTDENGNPQPVPLTPPPEPATVPPPDWPPDTASSTIADLMQWADRVSATFWGGGYGSSIGDRFLAEL